MSENVTGELLARLNWADRRQVYDLKRKTLDEIHNRLSNENFTTDIQNRCLMAHWALSTCVMQLDRNEHRLTSPMPHSFEAIAGMINYVDEQITALQEVIKPPLPRVFR